MGLDALVCCSCFKTGKTKPLPFPQDYVEQNEAGYIYLLEPYSKNPELCKFLDEWRLTACEHRNQQLIGVHVANWWGYRYFLNALEKVGQEHFPALYTELPDGNYCIFNKALNEQALEELRYFKEEADLGTYSVLVETENGSVIEDSSDIFIYSGIKGSFYSGFDKNGFYIRNERNRYGPSNLFEAMRFEQKLSKSILAWVLRQRKMEYRNLDTNISFIWTLGIDSNFLANTDEKTGKKIYPPFFHVEERKLTADKFDFMVDTLTQLFEASNSSGNPVYWC